MKRGRIIVYIIVALFAFNCTAFSAAVFRLDEGRFNQFSGTIDWKYKIRML